MKISFKFNMVEIALAMAIIAIGISSVLVLFPIGINATRAAMDESNAPEVNEFIASYIKSEFLKKWETEKDDASGNFTTDFTALFPADFPTGNFDKENSSLKISVKEDGTDIVTLHQSSAGIFQYNRNDKNGVFTALVKIWTPSNDFVADADGACKLYIPNFKEDDNVNKPQGTSNLLNYLDNSGNWQPLSSEFKKFAQSVLVEVSWGGENFDENKQTFRVEVYNPYYKILTTAGTP